MSSKQPLPVAQLNAVSTLTTGTTVTDWFDLTLLDYALYVADLNYSGATAGVIQIEYSPDKTVVIPDARSTLTINSSGFTTLPIYYGLGSPVAAAKRYVRLNLSTVGGATVIAAIRAVV